MVGFCCCFLVTIVILGIVLIMGFTATVQSADRTSIIKVDQCRMRIANTGQVLCTRTVVKLFEHRVRPWIGMCLGDITFLVMQIAEFDRLRRTCILASAGNFVWSNRSSFVFRLDFRILDSLDAVRAFFHYTPTSDCHFWIHHQVLQVTVAGRHFVGSGIFDQRYCIGVIEIVKATNLVGAVVATIPRPNTPVVNHVVEPLAAVHGRGDRANRFAGSILAMVTGYRLMHDYLVVIPGVLGEEVVTVIAVNPHPVHLAAAPHIVFADNRDIVFGLAGDDTGVATNALVEINRHPPNVGQSRILTGVIHPAHPESGRIAHGACGMPGATAVCALRGHRRDCHPLPPFRRLQTKHY